MIFYSLKYSDVVYIPLVKCVNCWHFNIYGQKALTMFAQNFEIEKTMTLKFNSTVSVFTSDNTIFLLNVTKSPVSDSSSWHRILISIHLHSMRIQRGGGGQGPDPPPLKNHKNMGFLS